MIGTPARVLGNRRIFVESAARPGHRALELRTGSAAAVQLPVGEGRSPRDDQFDIFVHGTEAMWKLTESRIVTACSSANTCRSCSTARNPPAVPP